MTTLIIAEKPKASKKIAGSLSEEYKTKGRGKAKWYELESKGEKILVVPAVGHLFNLRQRGKGWTYPVFDYEWVPSYYNKNSAFSKTYFKNLEKLASKADSFIVACDYDMEGDVIGYNIIRFICGIENAKRMKFSTLTRSELKKSFENLMDGMEMGQVEAGLTRHELDWLWGINFSRALTLAVKKAEGGFKVLSTGRVQGPALKILADREKEIKRFVPQPFWELEGSLSNGSEEIKVKGLTHPQCASVPHEKFWKKEEAEKSKKLAESANKAVVEKVAKRKYKQAPPYPFDLTSLQRESYRAFNIPPAQTLQITQSLYEAGLISYPRTSSQKLPPSIGYKTILKSLANQKNYTKLAKKVLGGKPNEGKKSDPAHPAIYPTGQKPKSLSTRERKIYDLVVKRFIATFGEPAVRESSRADFDINGEKFYSTGKRILEKNWIELYEPYFRIKEKILPDLKEGEELDVVKIDLIEKETEPPKRYTQTSIVTALEKKGLGTKATRSQIVQTLFERGYIHENSIKVSDLGLKITDTLEKYCPEMLSEEMTRNFEKEMERIFQGDYNKEKTIGEAKRTLEDILSKFKEKEGEIGSSLKDALAETLRRQSEVGDCPKCGERLRIIKIPKGQFIGCNGYKNGCRNTYPLPKFGLVQPYGKCKCGMPQVKVIRKGKRPWILCIDPECPSKEKWKKKKSE